MISRLISGASTRASSGEPSSLIKRNTAYSRPASSGLTSIAFTVPEVLLSSAGRYHKSVAQAILRWLTQRGVVIPKSVRKERMLENIDVFDFELSPADMAAIATLDTKTGLFFDHRDPNVVKSLGQAKRNT